MTTKRKIEDWMHGRAEVMITSTEQTGILAGMETDNGFASIFKVYLKGISKPVAITADDVERLEVGRHLKQKNNNVKREKFLAGEWFFVGMSHDYEYQFKPKEANSISSCPGYISKRKFRHYEGLEHSEHEALVKDFGFKSIQVAGNVVGALADTEVWFVAMHFGWEDYCEAMVQAGHFKRKVEVQS